MYCDLRHVTQSYTVKKYSLDYERYIESAELWSAVHRTPQEKQKWLNDREVSIVVYTKIDIPEHMMKDTVYHLRVL